MMRAIAPFALFPRVIEVASYPTATLKLVAYPFYMGSSDRIGKYDRRRLK
ncbi:MAG: hypothetical protein F6K48_01425 [Okeania sp. SIO3H1]|nr:hypothetical protein [Okeania sp. SIO3H1]